MPSLLKSPMPAIDHEVGTVGSLGPAMICSLWFSAQTRFAPPASCQKMSRVLGNGGFGVIGDIVVGVLGALLGGYLFGLFGLSAGGLVGSIVVATVGAIVLIVILRVIKKA